MIIYYNNFRKLMNIYSSPLDIFIPKQMGEREKQGRMIIFELVIYYRIRNIVSAFRKLIGIELI